MLPPKLKHILRHNEGLWFFLKVKVNSAYSDIWSTFCTLSFQQVSHCTDSVWQFYQRVSTSPSHEHCLHLNLQSTNQTIQNAVYYTVACTQNYLAIPVAIIQKSIIFHICKKTADKFKSGLNFETFKEPTRRLRIVNFIC